MKFGTSGLRGLVTELNDDVCYSYTRAFISSLKNETKSIAIAHDLRPSSPRIAKACYNAALNMGLEVIYGGAIPTPALAFYGQEKELPSIMVTGSHIPFDRNGLKFYSKTGEITKNEELQIVANYEECKALLDFELPVVDNDLYEAYMARYTSFFKENALLSLKIGIYQHSSVARDLMVELFSTLGADVIPLGRSNNFIPVDTEAVSELDYEQAAKWARTNKFDFLVSTDGDSDRPMLADENGFWFRGDVLGMLAAKYIDADIVVTPVSTTSLLEKSDLFNKIIRTKIGSPFVIDAMKGLSSDCIVGFEANGGLLLGSDLMMDNRVLKNLKTRDAILPILVIMSSARSLNLKGSQLLNEFPCIYTASNRIENFDNIWSKKLITDLMVNNNKIFEFCPNTLKDIQLVDSTDGCRFYFTNGDIIHLRASGNAPELRCYTESDTVDRAKELNNYVLNKIVKTFQSNIS
jgi:phosphomannomutase